MFNLKSETKIFIVLAVILVLFIVVYFYFPNNKLASDYIPNLVSEIVGILVVLFFVDYLIEKKYRRIAYEKLKHPLKDIVEMFAQMIKASLKVSEDYGVLPLSFNELFDSKMSKEISWLNFGAPAPIWPKVNWAVHGNNVLHNSFLKIDQIVDTYVHFIETSVIQELEDFKNDQIIDLIRKTKIVVSNINSAEYPILKPFERELSVTFEKIVKLLLMVEKVTGKEIKINNNLWENNVNPLIGDSRSSKNLDLVIRQD